MKRLTTSAWARAALAATLAACGSAAGPDLSETSADLTGGALTIVGVKASADDGNVPANVLDGDLSTRWSCPGVGCWIRADLGAPRSVTGVQVAWYLGASRVSRYAVAVSSDDVTYTQVIAGKSSGKTVQLEPYAFPAPVTARYVRLTVNGNTASTWASVTELRVFGAAPSTASTNTNTNTNTSGASGPGIDAFGTRNVYPSAAGGREWHARFDASPRVLTSGQVDPYDPQLWLRGTGDTLEIKGDGTAKSYGAEVRLYVGDRSGAQKWLNVEMTVYGMRVSETSTSSVTGFSNEARSEDGHTSDTSVDPATGWPYECAGHAYASSFRFDGRAMFTKEIKHPVYTSQFATNPWGGGTFPVNQWIGMKFVVYSVDGGAHVKQELWRDLTDGAGGGTWVKVNEHTDTGGWAIDPAVAATCGVPADWLITTPQRFIILRTDDTGEQWFKKVSVREIVPGP